MEALSQPFTNVQLELLKAFSYNLSEKDLKELKEVLVRFFAEKAVDEANRVWDEEGWNEEKVDQLLKTKLRTPYKSV